MLSLFMEESELHVKSIRVPFTGVAALHKIIDGVWKLLMLETSTAVEVVMLVHASISPKDCHSRSYGSNGYLLFSGDQYEQKIDEKILEF